MSNLSYLVLTDGHPRWSDGLTLGMVAHKRDGWYFFPAFQRGPSRKGWPTPEDALNGRVHHYRLEPIT